MTRVLSDGLLWSCNPGFHLFYLFLFFFGSHLFGGFLFFFFCFLVDISTLKSQRAPSFPFSFVILDLKIVFSHYIDYFL